MRRFQSKREGGRQALCSLIVTGLLATTAFAWYVPAAGGIQAKNPWTQFQHVIIVMMENHAYDNYFGTYCQATSAVCPNTTAGIPAGTCIPLNVLNVSQGCAKPFNFTTANLSTVDLNHYARASLPAWNNGSMNGWFKAEGGTLTTFGHYNGTTVPTYWDMAQEFGLGDHMFSSALSYSLPNHWFLIAANEPSILVPMQGALKGANHTAQHVYLNESNSTTTVQQQLHAHLRVSWAYYDYRLGTYHKAINAWSSVVGPEGAYNNWNPLAAQASAYSLKNTTHFQDSRKIFSDLTTGHLRNVSWVIPPLGYTDHPPENISNGQNFVASLVNAVGNSSYWNSTAIFVSWDEYGGFYDHVAPPVVGVWGDSFRVPLLVVSPWTPAGFVDHTNYSFDSLLALVEKQWGLGCVGTLDCSANVPTPFFNFSLHRAPVRFPTWLNASYPYVAPAPGTPLFVGDPAMWSTTTLPAEYSDG